MKNSTPVVIEKELAWGQGRASIAESLGMEWENPDDLAREKGLEYYDQVAQDPHVQSVWGTRIMTLVGCTRTFHAASDAARDQEVLEFVKWNLEEHLKRRSLATIVRQCFRSATKNGYMVMELLWNAKHDKGVVLSDVKDRDSERFLIKRDGLYLKQSVWDREGVKQKPKKYLVEAFDAEYENPYGTSLMHSIHWFVWFKKSGFKFWVLFLEKFGMPTVVAKIPEGFTNEPELERIRDVLDSIQQRTNITVPAGFEISLLEATRAGSAGAGYDILCDKCDQQISKAILGQTLSTQEGQRSGSYAQAKVHDQVRGDILIADGEWIDTLLNWQLIPVLVDYNFDVQVYPYIVTQTRQESDLAAEILIDEKLVNMGVRLAQSYFYQKYGRPEPNPGAPVVSPTAPQAADGLPPRLPALAGKDNSGLKETADEHYSELGNGTNEEEGAKKKSAATDALFETALNEGKTVFKQAFIEPMNEQLHVIFAHPDMAVRGTDADAFGAYLSRVLLTAQLLGRAVMRERLNGQLPVEERFSAVHNVHNVPPVLFSEDDDWGEILYEGLEPEEAERLLREKELMGIDRFNALLDEMKRAAFSMAKIEDLRVLELVQEALEQALKEGLTFNDFQSRVNEKFNAWGVQDISDHHLRTVFRTNVQTAYHDAAYQFLTDPEVAPLIEFLQYDAIDDARTRPAHAAVDGITLPADDDFWTLWWPPNGYNCRCDVIPITKYEAERRGVQATPHVPHSVIVQVGGEARTIEVKPDTGFASKPTVGGNM